MKNIILIFLLLFSLNVFSKEINSYSESEKLYATDTIPENLSDTSKIYILPEIVVKGSNVIQKSDRIILFPSSNMQKASSSA